RSVCWAQAQPARRRKTQTGSSFIVVLASILVSEPVPDGARTERVGPRSPSALLEISGNLRDDGPLCLGEIDPGGHRRIPNILQATAALVERPHPLRRKSRVRTAIEIPRPVLVDSSPQSGCERVQSD